MRHNVDQQVERLEALELSHLNEMQTINEISPNCFFLLPQCNVNSSGFDLKATLIDFPPSSLEEKFREVVRCK